MMRDGLGGHPATEATTGWHSPRSTRPVVATLGQVVLRSEGAIEGEVQIAGTVERGAWGALLAGLSAARSAVTLYEVEG